MVLLAAELVTKGVLFAQPGSVPSPGRTGIAVLEGLGPLADVLVLETPAVTAQASRVEISPGEPSRFAEPFPVKVTPASRGRWETAGDGRTDVWRLRVISEGAVSLNLGFTRYRMPPGGRLRVYTPDGEEVVGPFTDADNATHGQLWTPLISGGDAVIEAAVPSTRRNDLVLELASINRGFRDLAPTSVSLPSHDRTCHIDAACEEADPYRDQVGSVALLQISGRDRCTGVLLANTAGTRLPYMLTAEHCVGDSDEAASVVVYWNYQRPACGSGSASKAQSQSGALLRAVNASRDFALLELDDDIDRDHDDVYHAGWDRNQLPLASAIAFGHSGTHVKSIAVTNNPLTVASLVSKRVVGTGGYIYMDGWDSGQIEGGASGSPMFDSDKRVAALLVAGSKAVYAACGVAPNWATRISTAWTGGGSRESRLSDWLDPLATGETAIDGYHANFGPETVGTLDDKALRHADGAMEGAMDVDVSHGFADQDGDPLTYSATSSNESAVTRSVDGSVVTLAPLAAGSSTIEITATEVGGRSRTATQSFSVTVGENRSPEPAGTLRDLSLKIYEGAVEIDVAAAFEDDDDDDLTYRASSSNPSVAVVAVSDSTVSVTPLSGGETRITTTATDEDGSNTTARRHFDLFVNRSPQAAAPPSLLEVIRVDGAGSWELASWFTDAEGDALTYGGSSDDPAVATVQVSGSTMTVTPVFFGSATVAVTATDVDGSNTAATVSVTVNVLNAAPATVGAMPPLSARIGDPDPTIEVATRFSDPDGDALTYGASSSNRAVATAAVSGSTISLTPVAPGRSTITVTATDTDGSGRAARQSFVLTATIVEVEANFEFATYRLIEGQRVRAAVHLNRDPERDLVLPLTVVRAGAATSADHANVPRRLVFARGVTTQAFVFEALDDSLEEGPEVVYVDLNDSQPGVSAGPSAKFVILDEDLIDVKANFEFATYQLTEGQSVRAAVHLHRDPERDLVLPLTVVRAGAATSTDHANIPRRLVFARGVTTQAFVFKAIEDSIEEGREVVYVDLNDSQPGVSAGPSAKFVILDKDAETGDSAGNGGGDPGNGGGGDPGNGGGGDPGGDGGGGDTGGNGGGGDTGGNGDGGDTGGNGGGGDPGGDGGGGDPGGGGDTGGDGDAGSPPRAAIAVDAECNAGLCRSRTGVPVTFRDASSGDVRSHRWEFGGGTSSTAPVVAHAWADPGFHHVVLRVSDGANESTASLTLLVEAAEPAGACRPDAGTLCLRDSRFAVRAEQWNLEGDGGAAEVVHAGTNDSGLFRFFDPDNWELLIKVLDGCAANGHVWVFGASTTDLGYAIRVTDTVTGELREYRNEPGRPAQAITDARAFRESCGPRR